MPQKKNADSLELIRGKAGRIYGHVSEAGSEAALAGFKVGTCTTQYQSLTFWLTRWRYLENKHSCLAKT